MIDTDRHPVSDITPEQFESGLEPSSEAWKLSSCTSCSAPVLDPQDSQPGLCTSCSRAALAELLSDIAPKPCYDSTHEGKDTLKRYAFNGKPVKMLLLACLLSAGCAVTMFKKDPTADIVRTLAEVLKATPTPTPTPTPEYR